MIAVHTALYIFTPRVTAGEGGLYPYRHYAYVLWVIFPVVMASLAFINDHSAYVSEGTYCYLPVRPFWYRLALGWIPRYLIFIVILGIYASIYYFVRYRFNGFSKQSGAQSTPNASTGSADYPQRQTKRNSIPPTPRLACHGLIPESRQSSMTENDPRKRSASTMESQKEKVKPITGAARFMLASLKAENPSSPTPISEISDLDNDSFTGPSTPRPLPSTTFAVPATPPSIISDVPSRSRATSWQDSFVRRFSPRGSPSSTKKPSIVDMFTVLRQHPDSPDIPTPVSQLQLLNSRGQTFVDAEMFRTREKIRRQLRFLFIYPLVYIGMWILPFVSHVLQYDDKFAINPPFGLTCVTTICICSQAAVDSWLFSTREKPWRHIPETDGGFWTSLKFWSGWKGVGERRIVPGPGKTREEMVREARAAYQRRDEELTQRRSQNDPPGAHEGTRRGERSWWEGTGLDGVGAMSPVTEEVSNPMEEVVVPDTEVASESEAMMKTREILPLEGSGSTAHTKIDSSEPESSVSCTESSSTVHKTEV